MSKSDMTQRTIPINLLTPPPVSLGEASSHFRGSRSLVSVGVAAVTSVAASGIAGGWPAAVSAAVGSVAALAAVPLVYASWLALFSARCTANGTCCPSCLSRMWQLCCARCGEPMPPLALMFGGVFLPGCPHCGLGLSSREETLMAWCSTCNFRLPRPREFYRRPTHLAVLATVPPLRVPGGLGEVAGAAHGLVGFDCSDPRAVFVLLVTDGTAMPVFDNHVIARTSLLLLSSRLDEQHKDRFRSFFTRVAEREVE